MNAIVENLELRKNNFSKWMTGALTLLAIAAFFISVEKKSNDKWWMLAAIFMFGTLFYITVRNKISVSQQGISIRDILKEKEISWQEITSLDYHSSYHGHGVQLVLTIKYGSPSKTELLHVKQYRKGEMRRLFEILDQQTPLTLKNLHFIKQARGEMNWKEKLKMY